MKQEMKNETGNEEGNRRLRRKQDGRKETGGEEGNRRKVKIMSLRRKQEPGGEERKSCIVSV